MPKKSTKNSIKSSKTHSITEPEDLNSETLDPNMAKEEIFNIADPHTQLETTQKPPKKRIDPRILFTNTAWLQALTVLFLITTIASSSLAVYYSYQTINLKTQLIASTQPQILGANNETAQLLEEVGKLVTLPPNEQPTIATVTDPEKLKDQAFFAQSRMGDKVLIYNQAKRAILYRPSEHKIIEIAPLELPTPSTSPTPSKTK